jgi:hypothetical protein
MVLSLTDHAVHKHNILMKDFPLDELLAATDLSKIKDSVELIFSHLNKKLKISFVTFFSVCLSELIIADHIQYDVSCHSSKRYPTTLTTSYSVSSGVSA